MLAVEADCGAGRVGGAPTLEACDPGNRWAEPSTEGGRGKTPGIYLLNKPVCAREGARDQPPPRLLSQAGRHLLLGQRGWENLSSVEGIRQSGTSECEVGRKEFGQCIQGGLRPRRGAMLRLPATLASCVAVASKVPGPGSSPVLGMDILRAQLITQTLSSPNCLSLSANFCVLLLSGTLSGTRSLSAALGVVPSQSVLSLSCKVSEVLRTPEAYVSCSCRNT